MKRDDGTTTIVVSSQPPKGARGVTLPNPPPEVIAKLMKDYKPCRRQPPRPPAQSQGRRKGNTNDEFKFKVGQGVRHRLKGNGKIIECSRPYEGSAVSRENLYTVRWEIDGSRESELQESELDAVD